MQSSWLFWSRGRVLASRSVDFHTNLLSEAHSSPDLAWPARVRVQRGSSARASAVGPRREIRAGQEITKKERKEGKKNKTQKTKQQKKSN